MADALREKQPKLGALMDSSRDDVLAYMTFLRFRLRPDLRSAAGLLLMLFATIVYPVWGSLAGHVWPHMPAFGVAPCPTTTFTIGVLLTGTWRVTRWLLILLGLWAAVGGSAAVLLSVPQDFALLGAMGLLVRFTAGRLAGANFVRHGMG